MTKIHDSNIMIPDIIGDSNILYIYLYHLDLFYTILGVICAKLGSNWP